MLLLMLLLLSKNNLVFSDKYVFQMIPTEFINSSRIFCYKTVDLLNLYLMYLIITSFHSHETEA